MVFEILRYCGVAGAVESMKTVIVPRPLSSILVAVCRTRFYETFLVPDTGKVFYPTPLAFIRSSRGRPARLSRQSTKPSKHGSILVESCRNARTAHAR